MLESVALGVSLITWPIYADQHFNSKLAIKLGFGIQIFQHRNGIPDKQRVKDGVTLVLSKQEGNEMKRAAKKLKKMARQAVEFGGSSNINLHDFASEMYQLHRTRTAAVRGESSKLSYCWINTS
ncbi:hypothetical protein SUGI_0073650 [Cryptomeria japonica]|nr:hypothetical protein SUGI_0073650 [Cryptomeria japonica]